MVLGCERVPESSAYLHRGGVVGKDWVAGWGRALVREHTHRHTQKGSDDDPCHQGYDLCTLMAKVTCATALGWEQSKGSTWTVLLQVSHWKQTV